MRTSSCSTSSSYSHCATSLIKRRETLFKKAYELSTLCDIEVCVIHYGPDGELKTWPEDREKVTDMALRYSRLDEAKRCKKRVNLHGSLKNNTTTTISKKNTNVLKYPISDHYSPDQVTKLIQSLELAYSTLQERLRFVEDKQKQKDIELNHQKPKEIKLDHQGLTPTMSLNLQEHHPQTQSLNPSQYSLYMYNHGDATLSQIPLSAASLFDQSAFTNYSTIQDSGSKNHLKHQELNGCDQNNNFQEYSALQEPALMHKETYGYDQNMCLSDMINRNNFQLSNTQEYSTLQTIPESVNNYGLNQSMMQHDHYGYDQNNMFMSNSTSQHPYELCSDFQDPYSYMVNYTSLPTSEIYSMTTN